MSEVSDRCWLINESGKLVDLETDSKLDFHFDTILDQVAEWKKQADQDSNLLGNCIFEYYSTVICYSYRKKKITLCMICYFIFILFAVFVVKLTRCL